MSRPAACRATLSADTRRQRAAPGDEDRPRVGIVLGLGDEIGGDPVGPPGAGDDDDLGRPGVEIDRAVARDQRLRDGDVAVARPDDLVHARNRAGAVRQRRDRVGAADPEQPRHPRFERGRHHGRFRPRTDDHDLRHAGDPRRNGRHQQRRGQRKAAARHVAPDARQRLDALFAPRRPEATSRSQCFGNLPERDARDVPRRLADRAPRRPPARWPRRRASRRASPRAAAETPSNRRANPSSAVSPPARTRSTIAATRRSNARSAPRSRARSAPAPGDLDASMI